VNNAQFPICIEKEAMRFSLGDGPARNRDSITNTIASRMKCQWFAI